MISILLTAFGISCMTISAMSLFLSGLYTGNKEHEKSIIAGSISAITLVTSLSILSLI